MASHPPTYPIPEYPKAHIEYHIVTPRGRCAMIYSDYHRAIEHKLESGWKVIKVITTKYDVTPLTALEIEDHIDHIWSLSDYISYLNRDEEEPLLSEDLDHWLGYGIRTPRQLADHLDCEHARNLEYVD